MYVKKKENSDFNKNQFANVHISLTTDMLSYK